ncbi:MAG TPA: conjugal transfer protein TraX, partial [Lachnospiraceae bacterium]|nr:conjugal transfer protein TraX [Lachnospiraceae bacterium]
MRFGLNRSQLKKIALIFMVLDNVWLRFSTSFSSVAHLITRFVAPLFAWLMVDGFFHTKSRGRYCRRLWI